MLLVRDRVLSTVSHEGSAATTPVAVVVRTRAKPNEQETRPLGDSPRATVAPALNSLTSLTFHVPKVHTHTYTHTQVSSAVRFENPEKKTRVDSATPGKRREIRETNDLYLYSIQSIYRRTARKKFRAHARLVSRVSRLKFRTIALVDRAVPRPIFAETSNLRVLLNRKAVR